VNYHQLDHVYHQERLVYFEWFVFRAITKKVKPITLAHMSMKNGVFFRVDVYGSFTSTNECKLNVNVYRAVSISL